VKVSEGYGKKKLKSINKNLSALNFVTYFFKFLSTREKQGEKYSKNHLDQNTTNTFFSLTSAQIRNNGDF
jgi:hypothetical protein